MNFEDALKEACKQPTLNKALSFIIVWDIERMMRYVKTQVGGKEFIYESCSDFCIKQILENYKGDDMSETTEVVYERDPIKQLREKLEEEYKAKLIPFGEMPDDLKNWFFNLLRGKHAHEILLIFKNSAERIEIVMYTETYKYSIIANERHNYLGASYSARKLLAGENWLRGGDLSNGKYNKDTCDKIIQAIISNELVPLKFKL